MKLDSDFPYLVVSDGSGNIFEIPETYMVGMALNSYVLPERNDLIELPEGSDLFELPQRKPIGYNPDSKEFVEVQEYNGSPVFAAAAFMTPAYVQLYRSAYLSNSDAPILPLYAYTAVGWYEDKFYVTGKRIDHDPRQDFQNFNFDLIEKNAEKMLLRYPNNRLVNHLIKNCVLQYGCPAARNLVMNRWECPVPTSPSCNADCVGCISKQSESSGICSSQNRISFVPSVENIVEFTVPHLQNAPQAIISFGQGCEGEPLMVADIIEEAIKAIRKRTTKGKINLNTNASMPEKIERLFKAGLDSIRVSMNSAQKIFYDLYHKPINYTFEDVVESLKISHRFKRWSSLNYFVFPGFTDHVTEIAALEKLITETKVNMIQARNLNMDPEWYINVLGLSDLSDEFIGVRQWISLFQNKFPGIRFGYFNPFQQLL
ncbi:radical SAM protein [candidate division KSB1 bacterium]|nr:radical SAM protein [candidate division KSB1 bacterium]